jgi:zinc finger protein 830
MSLKSLLSTRKSQAQLTHPYAKYTSSRLSCSLCSLPLKHENLWSSHLVSKGHRVNVEAVKRREEKERVVELEGRGKRAREEEDVEAEEEGEEEGGLPNDFFADPSMAPPPASPSPEPVEEEEEVDPEWAAFEASLAPPPPPPTASSTAAATIFSAPVVYEFGAPKVTEEGDEVEPVEEEDAVEEETEEEVRERKEREEREEMVERMEEEEREQMEADEKVTVSLYPTSLLSLFR